MIAKTQFPKDSDLYDLALNADFCDADEVDIPNGDRSALQLYLSFVKETPVWIEFLMTIRNSVVRDSQTDHLISKHVHVFPLTARSVPALQTWQAKKP